MNCQENITFDEWAQAEIFLEGELKKMRTVWRSSSNINTENKQSNSMFIRGAVMDRTQYEHVVDHFEDIVLLSNTDVIVEW